MAGIPSPIQEIDAYHQLDEQLPAELSDVLQAGGASGEYSLGDFIQKVSLFLPKELIANFNKTKVKMFMGVFPSINRAWFTVDNRLFLWNYTTEKDFNVYDGLDQIIVSAAIVTPRSDVFVEEIKHVLLLATPVEVVMLALHFDQGDTKKELKIHSTKFALPTDNINILKMVGTKSGRIFMGGSDGSVSEMLYQAEDGWFSKKCRKLTHTRSQSLFSFIPGWLRYGSGNPIIDMAVDDARGALYTLSNSNAIEVWDLGKDGKKFQSAAAISNISDEVVKFAPGLATADKAVATTVVNIYVLSPQTDSHPKLLAVTKGGLRLYFTAHSDTSEPMARTFLTLTHVRFAAVRESIGVGSMPGGSTLAAHAVSYSNGVLILASARDSRGDSITASQPDLASYLARSGSPERANVIDVEGKVWSIGEIPTSQLVPESVVHLMPDLRNELATQHLVPPRQFVLLSSTGIQMLTKLRPIDRLRDILAASRGAETQELRHFFGQYGADQACAMCLILACAETRAVVASPRVGTSPAASAIGWHDPDLASWATQVFFRLGGRPSYPPPQGTQMFHRQFIPSPSAMGFSLYLARILRPIWKLTVFVGSGKDEFVCRLKKDQIGQLEMQLLALRNFLNNNPHWAALNPAVTGSGAHMAGNNVPMMLLELQRRRTDDEARKTEQRQLAGLHQLLLRSLEVISFIDILAENNLKSVAGRMSKSVRPKVVNTRFKEFVAATEGEVNKELVNSLVSSISDETKLEEITTQLRQRCASFFSDSDRVRLKAMDVIQRAKATLSPDEQRRFLEQSLDMFSTIAEHVFKHSSELLPSICAIYRTFHFYEGVVALCLKCAEAIDPSGVGLQWFKEGKRTRDDHGKVMFDARVRIFAEITGALDELNHPPTAPPVEVDPVTGATRTLDPISPEEWTQFKQRAMKVALKSSDELFHLSLYWWFLEHGFDVELTHFKTPFIENFLLKYCDNKLKSKQLLWQYYHRVGNRSKAAQILIQLAEHKGPELTLQQRLEHLSQALGIAQDQGGVTDHNLLREIQERIQVANVQLLIFQDLNRVSDENARNTAQAELDQELYNISDLYNLFAKKFGLCEAALIIIHISGHNDKQLVRRLWENLLQDELDRGYNLNKIEPLEHKLSDLAQRFYPSDVVLPLDILIDMIERQSMQSAIIADWYPGWVVKAFLDGGIPPTFLFQKYSDLLDGRSPSSSFWSAKQQHQLHLLSTVCFLLERWLETRAITPTERRQLPVNRIEAFLVQYLPVLPTMRDRSADVLVDKFRSLKDRITRVAST